MASTTRIGGGVEGGAAELLANAWEVARLDQRVRQGFHDRGARAWPQASRELGWIGRAREGDVDAEAWKLLAQEPQRPAVELPRSQHVVSRADDRQ